MINRFYLNNYLSFDKIELEFNQGLIVFSGASGAGKSILMNSILALFGNSDAKATISEVTLENIAFNNEAYLINKNEDFTIKQTTSTKTRYFLNDQSISKKSLQIFSKQFSKHLHLKDINDFDNSNIIEFLDLLAINKYKNYNNLLHSFKENYIKLDKLEKKLEQIHKDEKEVEDLKDFILFEIDKINNINPREGEYEDLKNIKDMISKKDKIESILNEAENFLQNTHKIANALEILDINSSFFDDTINEVNSHFESFYDKVTNIENTNIEDTLDRIEQLSNLIKKYGSINGALEYKKLKEIELEKYENISFEKAILEKNILKLKKIILIQTDELSTYRAKVLTILINDMNYYLKYLYLENFTINMNKKEISLDGANSVEFKLNNTSLNKVSSGELNRLRLALLTVRSLYEIDKNGILFLDEIDANLSGKESESIAKVLEILSKKYQIFAISHQPQLSAIANQHFLVYKQNNKSYIKLMDKAERISEISRMISGEDITTEAKMFAKKLLED